MTHQQDMRQRPASQAREPASAKAVDGPQQAQLAAWSATLNGHAPAQRQAAPPPPAANKTGLPDSLKAGVEAMSGVSMDHVKVHYRSSAPAQLQAHAFAKGGDIHLAPGQERHLPHEAWHVVQQAQGRVKPTLRTQGGVAVNDDAKLEHEADVQGAAAQRVGVRPSTTTSPDRSGSGATQLSGRGKGGKNAKKAKGGKAKAAAASASNDDEDKEHPHAKFLETLSANGNLAVSKEWVWLKTGLQQGLKLSHIHVFQEEGAVKGQMTVRPTEAQGGGVKFDMGSPPSDHDLRVDIRQHAVEKIAPKNEADQGSVTKYVNDLMTLWQEFKSAYETFTTPDSEADEDGGGMGHESGDGDDDA